MGEQASVGVVFWILAAEIVVTALMVVSLRNIFHCAIALIACLSGVAGIYILLHAEFLAAAQVLIYVGAVSILMVFAIMLTTDLASRNLIQTNRNAWVALLACGAFALGAVAVLMMGTGEGQALVAIGKSLPADNVMTVGKMLMTEFMLPFEVVSVLLLAAIIGAIVLARQEKA
jgi:NADH-quinone oxidoreductase subunit J